MFKPIIFLANRDIPSYFDNAPQYPHVMVSVVGGMGFLHVINKHTNRLYLVDHNEDQIKYCQLILFLISQSSDLSQFISFITGQEHIDCKHLQNIYDNTLGNPNMSCKMNLSDAGLENDIFYWRCGNAHSFSAFKNDITFIELKNILSQLSIQYVCDKLESIDYGSFKTNEQEICVYVSNCDSYLYTPGDKILHQIIRTMSPNTVRYRSWFRDITFKPDDNHKDAVSKIKPFTKGLKVAEWKTCYGYSFSKSELEAASLDHYLIEDKIENKDYHALLYHISLLPGDNRNSIINRVFSENTGRFERIIILDHLKFSSIEMWIDLMTKINLHWSYNISKIEWSGGATSLDRNLIIVWNKRG